MVRDDAAVARLADAVRVDLEADLASYDIRDTRLQMPMTTTDNTPNLVTAQGIVKVA